MNIQVFVNDFNNRMKIESGKEYNLGMLIKDLEQYKDEFLVAEFDDGSIPTNFDSWRGSYCELALNYKKEGKCHIDTLYRNAFNANGSMFVGYKGGDFVMDLDTPIHQANYGECGVKYDNGDYIEKKIIGIKKENNKIIILTRKEED